MTVRRRQFLGASIAAAAGTAAASLGPPGWLSRAFAQDRACGAECDEAAILAAAFRRAQQLGKPLLVFVIPEAANDRYVRGSAFGELINHGSDAQLAHLALAEVVCAKMSALRTLVPQIGQGEPLMVLVETNGVPATATALTAELPQSPRQAETAIRARIDALGTLVRRALLPDAASLRRRATQSEQRMRRDELARLQSLVSSGGMPEHALADRAAGVITLAAAGRASAGRLETRIADGARRRLRDQRVPGSRWASHSGCGTTIEGGLDSERVMMRCGMGHVPEQSRRFLYFFAPGERSF